MRLTDEQQQIRDTCARSRRTSSRRTRPPGTASTRSRARRCARSATLGVLGMVVPEQWGGAGLDYVSLAVAIEEIAAGDGATSTIVSVQNSVVCGPLLRLRQRRAEDALARRRSHAAKRSAASA